MAEKKAAHAGHAKAGKGRKAAAPQASREEMQEAVHGEKNVPAKGLYAAVMLKGTVKVHRGLVETLRKLSLSHPNTCIVVPADGTHAGMFRRISEFVAWGEVSEDMLEALLEKRGGMEKKDAKALAKKAFSSGGFGKAGAARIFRLAPPSGGLKSVRLNYPRGDMGYRGVEINALLERMI